MMVSGAAAAREWQAHGARDITTGLEPLLGAAVRGYLQAARARAWSPTAGCDNPGGRL